MDKNYHEGHRQRLNEKARVTGLELLPEHEQLEKILFAVIPRGNTNEIAHSLLDRFGSIAGVLRADKEELKAIEGVGDKTAEFLTDLPVILGIVERKMSEKAEILDTIEKRGRYLKSLFFGKLVENAYMVSLTSGFEVIKINKLSEGVTDETYIYNRKVAELAIKDKAHYVVLAHNHPGGTLKASASDVANAMGLKKALKQLGIEMLDMFVVAGGEYLSMAKERLI